MLNQAHKLKGIMNTVSVRYPQLSSFIIVADSWSHVRKVIDFLDTAASLTREQSGKSYITINVRLTDFNLLMRKCTEHAQNHTSPLHAVASIMKNTIATYQRSNPRVWLNLPKVLDPQFESNITADNDLLRRLVDLNHPGTTDGSDSPSGDDARDFTPTNLLHACLDCEKRSIAGQYDKNQRYQQATTVAERYIQVLQRWRDNSCDLPVSVCSPGAFLQYKLALWQVKVRFLLLIMSFVPGKVS